MALPARSLSFIDVGHGNCAILNQPSGVVVFDAGSRNSVLEFLDREKITKINYVIISHADEDHISGLLALFGMKIPIDCVYVNPDGKKHTTLWKDIAYYLQDLQKAGMKVLPITAQTISDQVLGPVSLEIVAPGTAMFLLSSGNKTRDGEDITTNTNSVVVRILDAGDPVALLTGDLDGVGLTDIEERGLKLDAKYLLFPHHGGKSGKSSSLTDFAEKLGKLVLPDFAVFSIGRNKYGNPKAEALEGLRKAQPAVHIACTQLSVSCGAPNASVGSGHLFDTFSRGKDESECCAGTVVVDLDSYHQGHVTKAEHIVFIQKSVSTPMCI